MFECLWCKAKVKPKDVWIATRKVKIQLSNPDGQEYETKLQPEIMGFCTKSHRNEYLYGV